MKIKKLVLGLLAAGFLALLASCETNSDRKHEHHSGNPSHPNHKSVPK